MSIAHLKTTRQLSQGLITPTVPVEKRSTLAWWRSPLWLCLLVALIARVWLIYRAQGLIDGTEAQIGVQALRILLGEHPGYFYGQPYIGSLSAYLLAPLFGLVGPEVWALRTEALIFSLLLVYLTWLLAGALADSARFSPELRRRFQTIAALIAALPPLYDAAVEMRVWGGYIETFVLGLLLMYWIVRLSQRWFQGIGLGESLFRWLGIGLVAGIGLWVDPLILVPVAVSILWLLGASVVALVMAPQNGSSRPVVLGSLGRSWLVSLYAVPAALIGFLPGLYWGYRHHWENIKYILHPDRYVMVDQAALALAYPKRLDQIRILTNSYLTCDAPRTISGLLPSTPPQQKSALAQLLQPQNATQLTYDIVLIIMAVCIVVAALLFLLSLIVRKIGFIRKLLTLPLLLGIGVSVAFVTSNMIARYQLLHTCDSDQTGRYAALLVLALPFLIAGVLTLISMGGDQASARQQYLPTSAGGMTPRNRRVLSPTNIVAKGIVLVMMLLYVATQGTLYVQAGQDDYFRSTTCKISLIHTDQALDYLKQQHIQYLWSSPEIGNVLMFKSATDVISTDPHVFTNNMLDRIPDYSQSVKKAEQVSLAFFAAPSDNLLTRLKTLDAAHIKYQTARFLADNGVDLVILTPVDYTFQPTEASSLITGGPSC